MSRIHRGTQEHANKLYQDLRQILSVSNKSRTSHLDALECLFKCITGGDHGVNYARPVDLNIGAFVTLDKVSSRIQELVHQPNQRESFALSRPVYCKILCSACYGKSKGIDLGQYEV